MSDNAELTSTAADQVSIMAPIIMHHGAANSNRIQYSIISTLKPEGGKQD